MKDSMSGKLSPQNLALVRSTTLSLAKQYTTQVPTACAAMLALLAHIDVIEVEITEAKRLLEAAETKHDEFFNHCLKEHINQSACDDKLKFAEAPLLADLRESQARELKLRGALEFYANGKNFQTIFDDPVGTRAEIYERYQAYSMGDLGVKAHEALSSTPPPPIADVVRKLVGALSEYTGDCGCMTESGLLARDVLAETEAARKELGL